MAALESGDLDELRQLLSSGADLNSPGRKITLSRLPQMPSYPLILAVDMNNFEAVRLLLDSGADPNICCEFVLESQTCWLRPLCHAADPRVAAMLLDAGAEVNAQQRSSDENLRQWPYVDLKIVNGPVIRPSANAEDIVHSVLGFHPMMRMHGV